MVLVAGLTSRREPASHSRRLVELAFEGQVDLIVTQTLLQEVYEVLVDPSFVGRMREPEATTLVAGLASVASVFIRDSRIRHQPLTDDRDDDYLAHAALRTGAFLVTRDDAANFGKVEGLRFGRPGTALRMIGGFDDGE
jgi:predicted nucleic acid-binding protein